MEEFFPHNSFEPFEYHDRMGQSSGVGFHLGPPNTSIPNNESLARDHYEAVASMYPDPDVLLSVLDHHMSNPLPEGYPPPIPRIPEPFDVPMPPQQEVDPDFVERTITEGLEEQRRRQLAETYAVIEPEPPTIAPQPPTKMKVALNKIRQIKFVARASKTAKKAFKRLFH